MYTRSSRSFVNVFTILVILAALLGAPAAPARAQKFSPSESISSTASTTFTNCASVSEIPLAECDALVVLYNSTYGAGWNWNAGWLVTDTPCSWIGVSCISGHVSGLDLDEDLLVGSLPSALGELSQLTTLTLDENKLSGSLPPELGKLSHLITANLGRNLFSGGLPPEWADLSALEDLWLDHNQLTGSLPPEWGSLPRLINLRLDHNQLTGAIPPEWGNLLHLTDWRINDNQLSGSLPPELGNLEQLTTLYLNNNQLIGSLPPELGNLSNLHLMDLSLNQLTDALPPELGNLSQLQGLYLSNNRMTGTIPPELGDLSQLVSLYLASNNFSGTIPAELGSLPNLDTLSLHGNHFTGSIPPQIGNLSRLLSLYLSYNELSGSIPSELGNLSKLASLYLNGNRLTGSIPPQIGNLTALYQLSLQENLLTGEIPSAITNLFHLTSLHFDCQLNSSDPAVIAFVDNLMPGWQERRCSLSTNDDFDSAITIDTLPYDSGIPGLTWATTAPDDPVFPCISDQGGSTTWYRITPDFSGTIGLESIGWNYRLLAVWTGERGSLVNAGCGYDVLSLDVIAGITYYIEISGYSGGYGQEIGLRGYHAVTISGNAGTVNDLLFDWGSGVGRMDQPAPAQAGAPSDAEVRALGMGGLMLSYSVDGARHDVMTQDNGDYIIAVPVGWSGTLTPYVYDYGGVFDPPSRSYNDLQADLENEDFVPLTHTLTVGRTGAGEGLVTSSPGSITCGEDCIRTYFFYEDSKPIELTASPSAGSLFTGWSGTGCSGIGLCLVDRSADAQVTAHFALVESYPLSVKRTGWGSGLVTSNPSGIYCGEACTSAFPPGTLVTLTATGLWSLRFMGWEGAGCSGTGTCSLTIDQATTISAFFGIDSYPGLVVRKTGSGSATGSVISSPPGITCGETCADAFQKGSTVTLIPILSPGSVFLGWSGGGCSGRGLCNVVLETFTKVEARFFALDSDRLFLPLVWR
jgi:Leucine-rich repeat (LRR) protein